MTIITSAASTRARAVVESLTRTERVGLLFHPMILIDADHDPDAPSPFGPSTRELIVDRGIRHLCLGTMPSPAATAEVTSRLQQLATSTGSRLPIVFSTDPRHSFLQVDGATHRAVGVSQWPEPIGLGAIGDAQLVRDFARVVRDDYRAMGIRMALHPQVDLTTDARWARQAQSFGTDATETSRLLRSFLEGLQGTRLDSDGVAAVVKHFPGGGAQKDGEDPHFPYGREQVYPGGAFETHLAPFRAAIDAGAAAIMPYYGMPVGLHRDGEAIEEVGFGFNRMLITDVLRGELGFEGVVLSDFGLMNDAVVFGKPFPARAWGVEDLSPTERVHRLLDAGVDQFGGEDDTRLVLDLLDSGTVGDDRIAESAIRIVALMERLGLLDPLETFAPPATRLPRERDVAAGRRAQSRAVTVLRNTPVAGRPLLPLTGRPRVHLHGVSAQALPAGWSVVDAADADFALVRLAAPFEFRDTYFLEAGMQQGSLDFDQETIDHVTQLARQTRVVLAVTLTRPAILTPLLPSVTALVGDFGASDEALIAALTCEVPPEGRLPFELPRSMAAVTAAAPDLGANTAAPLFPLGAGLDLGGTAVLELSE